LFLWEFHDHWNKLCFDVAAPGIAADPICKVGNTVVVGVSVVDDNDFANIYPSD